LFDAWLNMHFVSVDPDVDRFLKRPARGPDVYSVDDIIQMMGTFNISAALLTKVTQHPNPPFVGSFDLTDELVNKGCEEVAAGIARYPDRFVGSILLDPRLGYAAARHVATAGDTFGLRVVRTFPALSLLAPNDPLCYPLYTAACDRGMVVTINVGIPGPRKPAKYANPMALDDVALAFPDLKIVMAHMGDPWIAEVIGLLNKHPNLYLMTSGWSPKYIPQALLQYMEKRGPEKVMWASDYPAVSFERTVPQALALPLSDSVKERYLELNAREVFGMPARTTRVSGAE
jgi:predicted TIM-barrel fold metal-dependent hydrolase